MPFALERVKDRTNLGLRWYGSIKWWACTNILLVGRSSCRHRMVAEKEKIKTSELMEWRGATSINQGKSTSNEELTQQVAGQVKNQTWTKVGVGEARMARWSESMDDCVEFGVTSDSAKWMGCYESSAKGNHQACLKRWKDWSTVVDWNVHLWFELGTRQHSEKISCRYSSIRPPLCAIYGMDKSLKLRLVTGLVIMSRLDDRLHTAKETRRTSFSRFQNFLSFPLSKLFQSLLGYRRGSKCHGSVQKNPSVVCCVTTAVTWQRFRL
jgi:hypothetical protein